jgi:hypothetical protein
MNTLLVWDNCGESIDLFLLPEKEVNDEVREILNDANGGYINSENDKKTEDALFIINAALSPKKEYCDKEVDEKWHCAWRKYFVEGIKKPLILTDIGIYSVYICGFLP